MALAVLALLPLAACSKTDDQPEVREIFGSPPVITQTPILNLNQTDVICDMTDPYRYIAQRDFGFLDQNQIAADFEDLEVGMTYTEIEFLVAVADEDDDPAIPGSDEILAVTATYVAPGQPDDEDAPPMNEETLVLFDDGSMNKFSYTQIGATDFICNEGPPLNCNKINGNFLTSNDPVANDSLYTRRIATFDLALEVVDSLLLVQDCLALEKGQVILDVESEQPFDFRLDVVDRAGNITTWPTQLPAEAQKTTFLCTGDECLCCLLRTTINQDCSGLPGFGGLCGFF